VSTFKKWDAETTLDHTGERIVPLLIIEADGAMLKRQRRKKREQRFKAQNRGDPRRLGGRP